MADKIKIAFVIDTIETPAAGTEKQLLWLLSELDRSKFKPYLICLRQSEWLRGRDLSCDIVYLGLKRIVGPQLFGAIRQFRKLHSREHFDIVQTFFKEGNLVGTLIARLAGCRIIVSSRRNIGYWHNRGQVAMLRFLRRWTTHYLANSALSQLSLVECRR